MVLCQGIEPLQVFESELVRRLAFSPLREDWQNGMAGRVSLSATEYGSLFVPSTTSSPTVT